MSDARDDSSQVQPPEPEGQPGVPEWAGDQAGPESGPETEADRQAAKTIRSISRLEESN